MMENETSKDWIKVGIAFGNDINAKILCPSCKEGNLLVEDFKSNDLTKTERLIYCNKCGNKNYLLLNR